jgi:hypothetical protein
VFAANFVLSSYGTGAVMGNPSLDERDSVVAKQHGVPVVTGYPLGPEASEQVVVQGEAGGVRILPDTDTQRERERERERHKDTHTHTHARARARTTSHRHFGTRTHTHTRSLTPHSHLLQCCVAASC